MEDKKIIQHNYVEENINKKINVKISAEIKISSVYY